MFVDVQLASAYDQDIENSSNLAAPMVFDGSQRMEAIVFIIVGIVLFFVIAKLVLRAKGVEYSELNGIDAALKFNNAASARRINEAIYKLFLFHKVIDGDLKTVNRHGIVRMLVSALNYDMKISNSAGVTPVVSSQLINLIDNMEFDGKNQTKEMLIHYRSMINVLDSREIIHYYLKYIGEEEIPISWNRSNRP